MSSTTITASYTITPSEPTPNSPLILSDIDQLSSLTLASTIYVYKENPTTTFETERMRDCLSKLLVHYYPLAGRLSWEGDRYELNCNAKGVMFIEAQSKKTLAQYGDFAPNNDDETLKYEFFPKIDYTQPIEEIPLFIVQLTKLFQHGVVMGISMSHVLADGLAATRFIKSWAKLCRNETLDTDEMLPFLDRTALISSTYPQFDHPELMPLPLLLNTTDTVAQQKMKTSSSVLKLTTEQVETLKKTTNEGSHSHVRHYSTYEVVASHIWRCATKARGLGGDQPTVVRVTADIRNKINPSLPLNYFGNALAVALTPLCYAKDLVTESLSYGAGRIRETIELLRDEKFIRSHLDSIRCQKRLDIMRASYDDQEKLKNALFFGNPNIIIVSWMSMPVYEADFGWGKPFFVGPALVLPDGTTFIVRSSNGDGSLIVSIHLQSRHMELFKKFFYEDV